MSWIKGLAVGVAMVAVASPVRADALDDAITNATANQNGAFEWGSLYQHKKVPADARYYGACLLFIDITPALTPYQISTVETMLANAQIRQGKAEQYDADARIWKSLADRAYDAARRFNQMGDGANALIQYIAAANYYAEASLAWAKGIDPEVRLMDSWTAQAMDILMNPGG